MSATTTAIPTDTYVSASDPSRAYLRVLCWLFTLFNSARVLAYLPTIWALHVSGDSSQHSVWTWCLWVGGNVTMAAWLFEQNGRRIDKPVAVSVCNAGMCFLTLVLIVIARL